MLYSLQSKWEDRQMSTHEDRLTALEQASVSRAELTEAINRLERQQAQTLRDRSHETAITLGILTDDVRILKENVQAIRVKVNEGFPDLSQELYSIEEKLTKRFVSLEGKLEQQGQDIKDHGKLLQQILDRLPPVS